MQENRIEVHPDGAPRAYIGPQAVAVFQARTVYSALFLYDRTGVMPLRGMTRKKLLLAAGTITGKTYPPSKKSCILALRDLRLMLHASYAALTVPADRRAV